MRALVLSGGGVKGAYQVGVLKRWILEDGLDYEILCGVSVGALNAACLAQASSGQLAQSYSKLVNLWSSASNKKVWKRWFPFGKLHALWKPSILDSSPLEKWLASELDVKAIAESGRKLRVGTVSLETGEYRSVAESEPGLASWVTASASFPAFFLPLKLDGQDWTDGGVRNVTPLGEAIRLGATEIDVIMCSNPDIPGIWSTKGKAALPGYLIRTLELMADEITRTDLQVCGLKNDLAELGGKYRKVMVRVISPRRVLVEDSLDFDPAAVASMIKEGYADACRSDETVRTIG